jgi:protein ImuA
MPLADLRQQIARLERAPDRTHPAGALSLGPAIDAHLPAGGLARGALHEIAGGGADTEHAALPALFAAGALARARGPVIWALADPRLFAPPHPPALAAIGLDPDRVIYAEAGPPERVLMVLEEALRTRGIGAAVGEIAAARGFGLTTSRRLQLAAEAGGVPCLALRRSLRHDDPALEAPSAAVTRWRITALPTPPSLAGPPGIVRPLWRVELRRCRGGAPHSWIMEGCDAQGRLGVPAHLADRPAASSYLGPHHLSPDYLRPDRLRRAAG